MRAIILLLLAFLVALSKAHDCPYCDECIGTCLCHDTTNCECVCTTRDPPERVRKASGQRGMAPMGHNLGKSLTELRLPKRGGEAHGQQALRWSRLDHGGLRTSQDRLDSCRMNQKSGTRIPSCMIRNWGNFADLRNS